MKWFNPKYIVTTLIFGVVIFLLWKFRGILTKRLEDFSQEKGIAEVQYQAMRDYGTDEELLFQSLETLKSDELKKVYKAFGLRTYESGGKGLSFLGIPVVGNKLDLFGWYAAELNETERKKMRSIWLKSKLKLTF